MDIFDWNFKKPNKVKPIFIVAPIQLAKDRVNSLIKKLSEKKEVLVGISKDEFVLGLENSPQFTMLKVEDLEKDSNISVLKYYQRDLKYIFDELSFSSVIFINGSWSRSLHLKEEYWTLLRKKVPYKQVSPFLNEKLAINLSSIYYDFRDDFVKKNIAQEFSESHGLDLIEALKTYSFDWTGQVGAILVKENKVVAMSENRVLPYLTYSLHHGSIREKNFSPAGDLNHYDTIHAESNIIAECAKNNISTQGAKLYVNIFPCPTCARLIARSGIEEVIYKHDHSNGDAFKILEGMGVKNRREIKN